jgi:anti-sigma B factor antagonist
MGLDIRSTDEPGRVRLAVSGEVDLTSGHRLEQALLRAEDRAETVVLDLSQVEFFDSTGLQILLDADVRARDNGHRLIVVPGNSEAARVLELTQVADRLSTAIIE